MPVPCKHCESRDHTSFYCRLKPRRPIRSKKRINQRGKHYNQWQKTKARWFAQHYKQHYRCYICGKTLNNQTVTLDHIKSRSRHPELRYELSNLAPCCFECNGRKGSRSIEEMRKYGTD